MNKQQFSTGQDAFQMSSNPNRASTIYQNNQPQNRVQSRQQQQMKPTNKELDSQKEQENTQESIMYWLISLGLFLAAFAIYVGVWAVQRFALNHQLASHYYEKSYNWSDAVPSTHQIKITAETKTIALDLVLQWVMWKGPLLLFTYNCLRLNDGMMKWILFGVTALIVIAADVLLTIFFLNFYNTMIYFGIFSIVTIIMSIVGNLSIGRVKQAVFDSVFPLLTIAVLSAFQLLALPILYYVYAKNLSSQAALFLTFYAYPFVDMIMYALILFLGSFTSKQVRTFHSQIHLLLVGYEVGFILLIGYTEVEFYYLISYLIFRNIFSNWVMWKWDNVVKLPPLMPGWILAYYFSYVVMFLPFSGIGNIIIGSGYYSIILNNTSTLLYSIPSSLYPSDVYTPSATPKTFEMNMGFSGDIFKIAAGIVWVGSSLSQRYSKRMPEIIYSIFYNLVGIYLFFLGLAAGLSAPSLTKNSLIA